MAQIIREFEESGRRSRLELVRPPSGSTTALELVQALQAGEPWAARLLFTLYADDVQRVLTRMLGLDHELPDLLQEVFLHALQGIQRLNDPERLGSWLVGISVHVARRRIRSRRRSWWMVFLPHEEVPEPVAEPEDPEQRELVRATYRVLDRLNVDDRIILALRLLEGLEVMEVARAAQVSRATIKRRIDRAQARFRRLAAHEPALQEWAEGGRT